MRYILFLLSFFFSETLLSQPANRLHAGPWAGNITTRTAVIWAEVSPASKFVAVKFYPAGKPTNALTVTHTVESGQSFYPVKIELNGLAMNTTYKYDLLIDNVLQKVNFKTTFTTLDLWQWRKPAPDFTFLAGSCAYFNESVFDRPGKPYGGDSSIFETMAAAGGDFHIWMGDNWYTREVDFYSPWGLQYRASHDRGLPVLQKFMASMPQYAIWDDHDFGPDNSGKSYQLRNESREVFMKYSLNPTYGENGKGVYSKVTYSDVDFFLTDDRFFRAEEDLADSVYGHPNMNKTYFGEQQMDWLFNALLYSKAAFKIIVTGSQVLNNMSTSENMHRYPREYNDLMNFISSQQITGVIFMSGDRHHSEVIKLNRQDKYPLYDITLSPYTAGISKVRGQEINNPQRLEGTLVEEQNFGKISVSGLKGNRIFSLAIIGIKGTTLGRWSVTEKDLQ
ncbi:MAG: alkaline phosphatase D family protein [Ferruginibacter sp.]